MTRFLAALTIATGLLLSSSPNSCLEDEVRMYEGECVPLDDIREAAIDLYVEANMQTSRRYTEGD